ncbi:MAG: 16S rRNA (cytosine(1402)-N(4))-methyltransferase RsmH [Acidobacteriota bacterium]
MEHPAHTPVLLREVVEWLCPERGGFFVDATIGAGGHAEAMLERGGAGLRLLGIDRDPEALALARRRLARFSSRVEFREGDFADLDALLSGCPAPDGILADLGVSSMQLETPARGFSFRREGPLDMRMGRSGRSAAEIVAASSVEELTRIFREYGEERMAAKIARGIVAERARGPITTTRQLARIVASAKGSRDRIDPATRVFQALRIEVNQELVALSRFLAAAVHRANARGRIAVLSYHSLEDRLVKEAFRRDSGVCLCPPRIPRCVCGARAVLRVLTRRPVVPSEAERRANPRSRSARLRVAEKIDAPQSSESLPTAES